MTAVSGTVSLEFWTASAENIPVTVEIRQGYDTVQTTTVNLTSNGGYTVPLLQPLDYGTYSVTIKAGHWLRALGENITIPGGTFDTELKNGDATNDNVVDVLDLNYVLVRFATTDPTADLDGSGLVDLPDISIVLLNFTMAGVPPANNGAAAPSLDGLSGNGRNLLFIDLGSSSNPFAPYRVYRKAGGGNYSLLGETTMRLFLDTSATNGTAYTYKACVLNASGGEAAFSPEVVLTPTAQNPTCTATLTSETGTSQASGAVWANLTAFSDSVEGLALCLDGEYVDFSGNAQPSLSYDSECGRNGLRAALVVVWDSDERYGFSDITPMTFDNEFSVATLSVPEINPDMLETVLFACKLKEPQNFRVDVVEDATQTVVKTWTSPTPSAAVTYEWDGTDMYGTGVEDDTYWVTITLIDKDPTIASRAKRVEVSLSGLGTVRFVAVNNMPGGPNSWGQRKLRAIRAACKAAGVSLKVFNRENAYWDDYGPDQDRPGVASFLQTSYIRAFYANTHGNHWLVDGQPRKPSTSFELRQWQPTLPGWAPGDAVISVNRQVMEPLNIREGRLRLVWLDACGTGRRNAGIIPTNIKDPASWRNVSDTYMNDLAHFGFRIRNPHVNIDPACYYMGYFGYGYVNEPYYDMVRLFFSRFSEQSGTLHTIGAVMTWLANQGAVTNDFAGPPYIEGDWLTVCPPFYNIRVFTDTWRSGIGKYYDGLKMSDLR